MKFFEKCQKCAQSPIKRYKFDNITRKLNKTIY